MKRFLKIISLTLVILIGFTTLKSCDLGPPPQRPDLDLPLAPQMTDPTLAPMDMNFPPKNTFAADGVNPIPHGDPAQQDSTPIPGPMDKTRRLKESEIAYQYLGPGHFGAFTSGLYPDGGRVIWTNGVNGVFKLDEADYSIIDHKPSDVAHKYDEDWGNKYIAKLDKNNGASAMVTAVRSMMPLMDLSGVYTVVGANDWFYIAKKDGSVVAYGDEIAGDAGSKIVEKARFQLPPELAGASVGMNMTYDGWIVFPMEKGIMIAVSPDLTEYRSVPMKYSDTEDTATHGTGYGWVRNSIAIDDAGGIYAVSRNHMHKIVWTGDTLSTDEADGAWTAKYRNGHLEGSGATPSLMGFGDEDKFVVITDGDIRMNVTLFWRDDIPDDWQQIEGAPSRRIAGQAPADMGALKVTKIQSEQTVIVAGYGALVVNNTPRNAPFFMPTEGVGRGAVIGPLGNLEAVNWLTGEPTFHYILGGQKYNNMFSGPTIDEKGRVFVGAYFGRIRIEPRK